MTNYESNSYHVEDEANETSAAFSTLPPSQADGDAVMKLWHTTQLPDGQPLNVGVLFTADDIRGLQSWMNDQFGGRRVYGVDVSRDGTTVVAATHQPDGTVLVESVDRYQPDVDLFQEQAAALMEQCWCGGKVGPRVPGDELGLGCLADITHDWRAASAKSQRLINHERYVANHALQNDASDPHFFTDSGNGDCMCGESETNPVHFVASDGETARQRCPHISNGVQCDWPIDHAGKLHSYEIDAVIRPAQTGDGAATPPASNTGTAIPEAAESATATAAPSPSAEPEKSKRKRRTKVEIAYDEALKAYNADGSSEHAAALNEAHAALKAKDPGNSRLAGQVMDPEVAEVLSNNEPRTSGPSFATEPGTYMTDHGPEQAGSWAEAAAAQATNPYNGPVPGLPAQSSGFAPGQAPQLGAVEISPQEQQAASGFPCPVQSSDGRTCQRPYGHEIQTATNPEPKPHVYATVPSQLPTPVTVTEGPNGPHVSYQPTAIPAYPAAAPVQEHSPFAGPAPVGAPLSFQVPPTPSDAPTHAPSGAEMQPPAPAAPFWQQPQGGQ